jgi:hypothetical protein
MRVYWERFALGKSIIVAPVAQRKLDFAVGNEFRVYTRQCAVKMTHSDSQIWPFFKLIFSRAFYSRPNSISSFLMRKMLITHYIIAGYLTLDKKGTYSLSFMLLYCALLKTSEVYFKSWLRSYLKMSQFSWQTKDNKSKLQVKNALGKPQCSNFSSI